MKDVDNIGENPLFIQTLTLFRLLFFLSTEMVGRERRQEGV